MLNESSRPDSEGLRVRQPSAGATKQTNWNNKKLNDETARHTTQQKLSAGATGRPVRTPNLASTALATCEVRTEPPSPSPRVLKDAKTVPCVSLDSSGHTPRYVCTSAGMHAFNWYDCNRCLRMSWSRMILGRGICAQGRCSHRSHNFNFTAPHLDHDYGEKCVEKDEQWREDGMETKPPRASSDVVWTVSDMVQRPYLQLRLCSLKLIQWISILIYSAQAIWKQVLQCTYSEYQ